MKALLVDSHSLVRQGLESLLMKQLGFKRVLHAENSGDAMKLLDGPLPDLVLVDSEQGDDNGLTLLARIKNSFPKLAVVMMSDRESVEDILRYLDRGASGFIPKNMKPEELTSAVERIIKGELFVPTIADPHGSHRVKHALKEAESRRMSQLAKIAKRFFKDRGSKEKNAVALNSAFHCLLDELESSHSYIPLSDDLTGLANYRLFLDRTESGLRHSRRRGTLMGLAYLNIDKFKQLNDAHGYAAGDEVLLEVARRLVASVRETDTVARLGADEFTLVFLDLPRAETEKITRELYRVVSEEIHFAAGQSLFPEVSLALAISDGHEDLITLMTRLDDLMNYVQHQGKNQYAIDLGE
ncbi:diguanylate cyclase (GGDEF) domain-containing protein [Alteromonadaceae bacterium Bs31]|nr:diguanylate cyclase (GGDEF) domain-containing protein [Alteromonadaceae bacterium Bs31]